MLRRVNRNEDSSLSALLEVRKHDVERATLGLRDAERAAEVERAQVAAAASDLRTATEQRDSARVAPLPGTFRSSDLVQREAHLAALAAVVAGHESRVASHEARLAAAEAVCTERRTALARALAEERAVAVALEGRARVRAVAAERRADDDALEVHAHETRRS